MNTAEQQISLYDEALNNLEQADNSQFPSVTLRALIVRDKVALALSDEIETANSNALELLTKADRRLADLAVKVETLVGRETLGNWRRSFRPGEDSWWWKLEDLAVAKQTWLKRLSTFLAILLFTFSIVLLADTFNHLRGIGANPVSTLGVLTQGALAFIAASAFTEAGRKWLVDKFARARFGNRTFKGWARTALALAVFGFTLAIWFLIPTSAAGYFHWQGDRYFREGLYLQAVGSYQQASSLKPYSVSHHVALAKAAEKTTDYAKAIAEYKSSAALYERPGASIDDSYFFAKCELIRLLILNDKSYGLAFNHSLDLQKKIDQVSPPNRTLIQYFILTYQGWVELERKHYGTAKTELEFALKLRDGPVAHYLLGQVFEALKRDKEAKDHFTAFLRILQRPDQFEETPPDWISYAQERTIVQ